MKQFLIIERNDKKFVKMVNQTEKGFDIVITSDYMLEYFIKKINNYKKNNDEVDVIWQMKFKHDNYITYKNCVFSEPEINYFSQKDKSEIILGKKIKVSCSGVQYYTNSNLYKNSIVKKTKHTYKDGHLLERMIKISFLNSKEEYR